MSRVRIPPGTPAPVYRGAEPTGPVRNGSAAPVQPDNQSWRASIAWLSYKATSGLAIAIVMYIGTCPFTFTPRVPNAPHQQRSVVVAGTLSDCMRYPARMTAIETKRKPNNSGQVAKIDPERTLCLKRDRSTIARRQPSAAGQYRQAPYSKR